MHECAPPACRQSADPSSPLRNGRFTCLTTHAKVDDVKTNGVQATRETHGTDPLLQEALGNLELLRREHDQVLGKVRELEEAVAMRDREQDQLKHMHKQQMFKQEETLKSYRIEMQRHKTALDDKDYQLLQLRSQHSAVVTKLHQREEDLKKEQDVSDQRASQVCQRWQAHWSYFRSLFTHTQVSFHTYADLF
jgi:chromosome segregation ATPase